MEEKAKQVRIAVLGDSATQHLSKAVKKAVTEKGFAAEVYDADYNQIEQQLFDKTGEVYAFQPDFILLFLCVEKLYAAYCAAPLEKRAAFAEEKAAAYYRYWSAIGQSCKAKVLQYTFVEKDDGVFGNYALHTEQSFLWQVKKLNLLLMEGASGKGDVFLLDLNKVALQAGWTDFHSDQFYDVATMSVYLKALPLAAKAVADVVSAVRGKIKKCVVLDLDNTLWGGVIGDDGLEGIEIGELGNGRAFVRFQRWLKELTYRGIILCVCSKNEEKAAKLPFEKHPDMVLRLDDIAVFAANWENKADNIKRIQSRLNIGMDSMVFLDDNEFERELVKNYIPELCVPNMPKDPSDYVEYLQSLNLFETASYSENDRARGKQYKEEAERAAFSESFSDVGEYLSGLNMEMEYGAFEPFQYPRIAQLSQRSNQFNLRTVRYTEEEIKSIAQDEGYITLQFCMHDRFGDQGMISAVILQKQADGKLFIDTWFMSCRVLKRTTEEFIVNKVIERAKEAGFTAVIGEYLPTAKNAMVADIYEKLGFKRTGNGRFEANVADFKENKDYIRGIRK
jgi:FkbH-like protein